jgi:predicted ATPase with chaperone activity
MIEQDGVLVPQAPTDIASTGIDHEILLDLALKLAHTAGHSTTQWIAGQMRMPVSLVEEELLQPMTSDRLLEVLGQEGPFNRRYAVSLRGRERALQLLNMCGYIGPAPVTVELYRAMLRLHQSQVAEPTFDAVRAALSDLVLPPEDVLTAALAVVSQRSLFLFGPAGNGKTSIARLLHDALVGELWIPHAISVGNDVIRLFDPYIHHESEFSPPQPWKIDQRWVRVRRPLVVAGGEMTIESLELSYSPHAGFYEAPLHMKANGGLFMIDDLGRQRVDSTALLNRWIIPMEHGYDFLALQSGIKIKVPFQQMLIVATNLDPDKVMDPAFLRRMGYRIHVVTPSPERYREIFDGYAARCKVEVPSGLVDRLLERYRKEGRELRGCEPRDLISRTRDICRLRRQPMELNDELLDLAWCSYFGTKRALV